MDRILIAFYSRTGTTRRIAGELAQGLGAELLAIDDVHPRRGVFGYLRSAREAVRGDLPEIAPLALDPAHYELVVLGTPVWASHLSSPMRRFLHDHGRELRRVAFFCTFGGSGAQRVFAEMRALAGREPVATCALTDRDIRSQKRSAVLGEFVARLRGSATRSAPAREENRHVDL